MKRIYEYKKTRLPIKITLDDFEDDEIQDLKKMDINDNANALQEIAIDLFNEITEIELRNAIDVGTDAKRKIKKLYSLIILICKDHNIKCPVYTREKLKEFLRHVIAIYPNANLNWIDTSHITNMMYLFDDFFAKNFCGDISEWDISNVTNTRNMFYRCEKFNCNISKWNVSNVKVMGAMFAECYKFNLDISKWNVSNVTEMSQLFAGCHNFNLDISEWDVSNVTDMAWMFSRCNKFNLDLSKWDVSNVTRNNGFYYKAEFAKYPQKVPNFDINKTMGNA